MLRELGSPWNFEVGSRWLLIERVAGPIFLFLIRIFCRESRYEVVFKSSDCSFHCISSVRVRWSQLGVYLIFFHSFFQVTITLVFHHVKFQFATSYFEDLVDIKEHIAEGCCLPVFNWFSHYCITIIVIYDHNIHINLFELCGKAPVRLLKPFLLIVKGMIVAHS